LGIPVIGYEPAARQLENHGQAKEPIAGQRSSSRSFGHRGSTRPTTTALVAVSMSSLDA
jgi:hypothetical protein